MLIQSDQFQEAQASFEWHVVSSIDEMERESLMIFDANGRQIATVDEWLQLPEDEAKAIAQMIVAAVNGFSGSEAA